MAQFMAGECPLIETVSLKAMFISGAFIPLKCDFQVNFDSFATVISMLLFHHHSATSADCCTSTSASVDKNNEV